MAQITVMKDQLGASGKKVLKVDSPVSPHEVLSEAFRDSAYEFDASCISVYLNGKKLNLPSFDENGICVDRGDESEMTSLMSNEDHLIVMYESKTPVEWILFAITLIIAVITYMMIPKLPQQELGSNNNAFFGQTNSARPYSAIPDIYGRFRAWPDLATAEPLTEYIAGKKRITQLHCLGYGSYNILDRRFGSTPMEQIPSKVSVYEPDSNGITIVPAYISSSSIEGVNSQEVRRLDDLGAPIVEDGEGGVIISLDYEYNYTDDTIKFRAFGGAESFFLAFDGTNPGSFIMTGTVGANSVNGTYSVEEGVTYSLPLVGPIYIDITVASASTSNAYWAGLLTDETGTINVVTLQRLDSESVGPFDTGSSGTVVQVDLRFLQGVNTYKRPYLEFFAVIKRIDQPGGTEVDSTDYGGSMKVYGPRRDNFKQQSLTFYFNVPLGFYRITVYRETVESSDNREPSVATLEKVAIIRTTENKVFENVTLIELTIDELNSPLSPRENLFNCLVERKTISYDADLGVIDYTLRPSLYFADHVLHMHNDVFKRPSEQLDVDGLYAIQDKWLPRAPDLMENSVSFDDLDMPLGERIGAVVNSARCQAYMEFGVFRFFRDEKIDVPRGLICARNISSQRNYSRTFKTFFPSSKNGITLEYIDPVHNKKAYINRTYDEFGNVIDAVTANMIKVEFLTCHNRSQAINRANFEAAKLMAEGFTVSDTVMREGNSYDIGDVIKYQDLVVNDIDAGEVLEVFRDAEAATATIVLSESIRESEHDQFISYTNAYGDLKGPYPYTDLGYVDGKYTIVMNIEDSIEMFSAYIHVRQLGSRYVISNITNAEVELFRIIKKVPKENGDEVQLDMVQYTDKQYSFESYLNETIFFDAVTLEEGFNRDVISACVSATTEYLMFGTERAIADPDLNNGAIFISTDGGLTFLKNEDYGSIGTPITGIEPLHITSYNGTNIIVGLTNCYLSKTTDAFQGPGPITIVRYANTGADIDDTDPLNPIQFSAVVSNDNDGQVVLVCTDGGHASISTDFATSFTQTNIPGIFGVQGITCAAISNLGNVMLVCGDTNNVSISDDTGATWTNIYTNIFGMGTGDMIVSCDMNSTGNILIVGTESGLVYVSRDGGLTFTVTGAAAASGAAIGTPVSAVRCSSINTKMLVTYTDGSIAFSVDAGLTWGSQNQYANSGAAITQKAPMDLSASGDIVAVGFDIGFASKGIWS